MLKSQGDLHTAVRRHRDGSQLRQEGEDIISLYFFSILFGGGGRVAGVAGLKHST